MAPTFYHYLPAPMGEQWKGDNPGMCRQRLFIGFSVVLVVLVAAVVGLAIALSVYVTRYHSEACQDGVQLEKQCRNATELQKKQLTQVKEELLAAETQADTCNQTVMKLMSQELKLQKQVHELEGQVTKLNQRLQETSAELEQLRKKNAETTPARSQATSVLQQPVWLLLLGLCVLLL